MMWVIDALQTDGDGILLYVLYEVLTSTSVGAIQLSQPTKEALIAWLQSYRDLPDPVLATPLDVEKATIEALQASWRHAPISAARRIS